LALHLLAGTHLTLVMRTFSTCKEGGTGLPVDVGLALPPTAGVEGAGLDVPVLDGGAVPPALAAEAGSARQPNTARSASSSAAAAVTVSKLDRLWVAACANFTKPPLRRTSLTFAPDALRTSGSAEAGNVIG
jgi:hypothetical protein